MITPIMLTIKQVAERSGIPIHALRRWVAGGQVYAVRSGSRYYVSWGSLTRFLEGSESDTELFGRVTYAEQDYQREHLHKREP